MAQGSLRAPQASLSPPLGCVLSDPLLGLWEPGAKWDGAAGSGEQGAQQPAESHWPGLRPGGLGGPALPAQGPHSVQWKLPAKEVWEPLREAGVALGPSSIWGWLLMMVIGQGWGSPGQGLSAQLLPSPSHCPWVPQPACGQGSSLMSPRAHPPRPLRGNPPLSRPRSLGSAP